MFKAVETTLDSIYLPWSATARLMRETRTRGGWWSDRGGRYFAAMTRNLERLLRSAYLGQAARPNSRPLRACIRSHLCATNNAGTGACMPAFRSAPAASMLVRCAPDRKSIDRADSSRSRSRFDSVGRQRLSLSPSLSLVTRTVVLWDRFQPVLNFDRSS